MKLNIHDTTPASKTPRRVRRMMIGTFALIYSIFAMMAFVLIFYAGHIPAAIAVALLPLLFGGFVLWDILNLTRSCIEISPEGITVTEYPFGVKRIRHISYHQIHHAELLRPLSPKLRGPRIRDIGIPYLVFYDDRGTQLFKLLAYPQAVTFQKRITILKE